MSDKVDNQAAGSGGPPFSLPAEPVSASPTAFLVVHVELPFKGIRPNDRADRWDKASQYKDYVQSCFVDARNAQVAARRGKLDPPVRAQAVYNFHKSRGRDGDNLAAALKGCWDGFVRAGLLAGDTITQLFILPVEVTIDKTRPEGVTITLTEQPRKAT